MGSSSVSVNELMEGDAAVTDVVLRLACPVGHVPLSSGSVASAA